MSKQNCPYVQTEKLKDVRGHLENVCFQKITPNCLQLLCFIYYCNSFLQLCLEKNGNKLVFKEE